MPSFWIGIAMVVYDASGHALCLLARICGQQGANLWNSYSRYAYPALGNTSAYDLY